DPRSLIVSDDPNYRSAPLAAEAYAEQAFVEGDPGLGTPEDVTTYGATPHDPDKKITPPEDEEITPSAIIGEDDRYRVDTLSRPQRSVVLIRYAGGQRCTGWMFGTDLVITAGHCVFENGA